MKLVVFLKRKIPCLIKHKYEALKNHVFDKLRILFNIWASASFLDFNSRDQKDCSFMARDAVNSGKGLPNILSNSSTFRENCTRLFP